MSNRRHADARVYFSASDGERWRVHDAIYAGGRRRVVPTGDMRANTRYFVNACAVVRATALIRTESRAVDIDTLARHFAQAGFVAQSPANIAAQHPR